MIFVVFYEFLASGEHEERGGSENGAGIDIPVCLYCLSREFCELGWAVEDEVCCFKNRGLTPLIG